MVIVLAIMAASSMIVIPALNARFGNEQPQYAGESVMKLLRDARSLAISNKQSVILRVDPVSGFYRVDTSGVAGTGMYFEGELELGAWESLITDQPRLVYVFKPTGAAFGDSVIVRGDGATVLITLDPWSGVALIDAR